MLISAQRFLIPGEIDKTYPFPVSHNNTCLSFPLFNYEYPPTSPSDGTSCTIANVAYRPTHRRQVYHSQGSLSLTQRPRSYVETASDIEQFDVALALSGENAFASRVYWQTFHTHTQHALAAETMNIHNTTGPVCCTHRNISSAFPQKTDCREWQKEPRRTPCLR